MFENIFIKRVVLSVFLGCFFCAVNANNTRVDCAELLTLAQVEFANKNYTLALDYFSKVNAIAVNNGWTDIEAKALSDLGLLYTNILDYEKAMECYLKAYKITVEENNKKQEIIILNNISQLYFINEDINKAKEYLDKAYNIASELQDIKMKGAFAINLSTIANQMKDYDKAKQYADVAIMIFKNQESDSNYLFYSQLAKIVSLYSQKEYDDALQLAFETYIQVQKQHDDELEVEYLLILSKLHEGKNDNDKAIDYAKKTLSHAPKLPMTIEIHTHLAYLYRKINSLNSAILYQDSVLMLKDSSVKLNDMSRVKKSQIQFDLLNSERKLAEKNAKQNAERMFFLSIFVFIIILAGIIIWVLRFRSIKNKQQRILELDKEKSEKLLLSQQLREQEILSVLEQERLNNEIEIKNNQLVAKTLFQSNRNEFIQEIITTLSELSNTPENPVIESIIRKLKSQLKESANLDNFLDNFKQINPSLLSFLSEKHPNLNASDIRLLSYMYLYLDTKKIAQLLNISVEACNKKKQRLAGKMGLKTNELYDYLANLNRTSF